MSMTPLRPAPQHYAATPAPCAIIIFGFLSRYLLSPQPLEMRRQQAVHLRLRAASRYGAQCSAFCLAAARRAAALLLLFQITRCADSAARYFVHPPYHMLPLDYCCHDAISVRCTRRYFDAIAPDLMPLRHIRHVIPRRDFRQSPLTFATIFRFHFIS